MGEVILREKKRVSPGLKERGRNPFRRKRDVDIE